MDNLLAHIQHRTLSSFLGTATLLQISDILPLLLLLSYLLVKWRTFNIKLQNDRLSKKVDLQTRLIKEEKKQLATSLKRERNLTRELNLSQTLKNRMYAQISHEFKSPLQSISSFISKNRGDLSQNDKQKISSNIQVLLDTSNEILALSKAESGELKLKKNYYNFHGIIKDQIELKYIAFSSTSKYGVISSAIELMVLPMFFAFLKSNFSLLKSLVEYQISNPPFPPGRSETK